jgi:heat-inducible transcriptional repressor
MGAWDTPGSVRRLAPLYAGLILSERPRVHAGREAIEIETRITSSLLTGGPSLGELDERARDIFRRVVESYLETGEPVGSRTLSKAGLSLSPASIRNTMQDLTQLGLLGSPHVSAGRLPTHAGLRLFVDGLLEVGDVGEDERRSIEARLHAHGRNFDDALNEASAILSGLAGGAGVVVTPVREAGVKHVEFVSLGDDRALAVMVFADGAVENRIVRLAAGVTPSSLQEASNFLNEVLRGRTLVEARADLDAELTRARRELDETAARLVEDGFAAWGGGDDEDRALIVRGRANLLGDRETMDLDRAKMLFDDLEQKGQLIQLLDGVRDGEGVRIFIGAETRLFSLSGSAVIAAPYMTGRQRVLGAIGVIGPARLNYARIIPLVDYTARVLGQVINA